MGGRFPSFPPTHRRRFDVPQSPSGRYAEVKRRDPTGIGLGREKNTKRILIGRVRTAEWIEMDGNVDYCGL
jgi:hypothetical protein